MYTGKIGNPHLETLLEQPADPETWVSPTRQRPFHGFASYLAWPETGRVGNILQMKEVTLDQGALGHSKVKPTTLMTDIPEVLPLHGMKAAQGQCTTWSDDLETRLQEAREAAEWSPGLVQVLQTAILRKQRSAIYAPRRGQVMRNPEKWRGFLEQQRRGRERLGLPPRPDEYLALRAVNSTLEEWKRHILNEHQPARRDCAECLRAMGRSRPHHRNAHVSSYALNIDVAGPFPAGHDQGGLAPRYFMVGVYTLPVKDGEVLVEALQEMGGCRFLDEAVHGSARLRQQEQELLKDEINHVGGPDIDGELHHGKDDGPEGARGDDSGDQGLHPAFQAFGEERKQDEVMLSEAEMRELDLKNKKWEEHVSDLSDIQIQNITMAIPLRSRQVVEITKGLSYFYAKLKSLGLPLHRVHSDRAKEFVSRQFATWIAQRDVMHTTTAGDEHQEGIFFLFGFS